MDSSVSNCCCCWIHLTVLSLTEASPSATSSSNPFASPAPSAPGQYQGPSLELNNSQIIIFLWEFVQAIHSLRPPLLTSFLLRTHMQVYIWVKFIRVITCYWIRVWPYAFISTWLNIFPSKNHSLTQLLPQPPPWCPLLILLMSSARSLPPGSTGFSTITRLIRVIM